MLVHEKFYKFADFPGPGVVLRWKPNGTLPFKEEIEELLQGGYIFRTVYEETLAAINAVDDAYNSR